MAKPLLYIAEVLREALDPATYVARLVSRAEGIDEPLLAVGKNVEGANGALCQLLKAKLGRDAFPINYHVLPETYLCVACKRDLVGRLACIEHRRSKHGATGNIP